MTAHCRRPGTHAISRRGSSFGNEDSWEERWSSTNLEYIRNLWSLDEDHYCELVVMKDKLADIDHWKNNPYEVMRFLSGPQNFEKTEELFRAMVQWRLDNNIDTILDTYKPPKTLLDYIPSAILAGYDKDGDPIYLERGGAMDGAGLLNRFGRERLIQHVIWCRELAMRGRWIKEYERVQGRPPTRVTIIYDLQGLSSQHLRPGVLPLLNETMRITQQRYNGMAKRMIVIRAPSLFNVVWGICKYAFPKGAQKKMVFSGPRNYLQVLDQYVDREVLPPCIVPGGKGQVAIDMPPRLEGGIIPLEEEEGCVVDNKETPESSTGTSSGFESDLSSSYETLPVPARGSQIIMRGQASSSSLLVSVRCTPLMRGSWVHSKGSEAIQVLS